MLKFLVLLACAHCARGADLAEERERDPMLWALERGGAVRVAVCAPAAAAAGCAGAPSAAAGCAGAPSAAAGCAGAPSAAAGCAGAPSAAAGCAGAPSAAAGCAGAPSAAAGCAGALWARHWVLARASCVCAGAGAPAQRRAPVVLYIDPGDCQAYLNARDRRGYVTREVLARFVHPAYLPPADDEDEMELLYAAFPSSPAAKAAAAAKANKTALVEWDPLDAVLLLLATPARVPPNYNYSATYETLMPQLVSWLRYVPVLVPSALESRPPPQPRWDPARVPLLDSPLRLLLAAVVLPASALLLGFFLVLRVPERCDEQLKLLEAADSPDSLTPEPERRAPPLHPRAPEHKEMV